jgi:hypothetical protein
VECKVGIELVPGRRFIDEGISQEVAEDAERAMACSKRLYVLYVLLLKA